MILGRFVVGLIVSSILATGLIGPIQDEIQSFRAGQLSRLLKELVQSTREYARSQCPGLIYSGTTPTSCPPSIWPTTWTIVAQAGFLPSGLLQNGQVLSPLDGNPVMVGPSGGNMGIISVAVSNAGIGSLVAQGLSFASYSGGTLSVPVTLSGTLSVWDQANMGILNTNVP